jgi:hypothetical protein
LSVIAAVARAFAAHTVLTTYLFYCHITPYWHRATGHAYGRGIFGINNTLLAQPNEPD